MQTQSVGSQRYCPIGSECGMCYTVEGFRSALSSIVSSVHAAGDLVCKCLQLYVSA